MPLKKTLVFFWLILNSIVCAAQKYPDKPIKLLVPFLAGGTSDIVARALAQKMTDYGYLMIVENKPGANGGIASEFLAKAPADGYTLMVGSLGSTAINPSIYKNLKYDPIKDFAAITIPISMPNVLVINPNIPVNNIKEFIDYAKKNPSLISYGSAGAGSADHLCAELFKLQTNTQGIHVPYKGGSAVQTEIMAGNITGSFQNFGTVSALINSGKLKALAMTSKKRVPQAPNTPTLLESGVTDFEITVWQALLAPKNTPQIIIDKLNADIVRAINSPDISQKFINQGYDLVLNKPQEAEMFIRSETSNWASIVKKTGATVE